MLLNVAAHNVTRTVSQKIHTFCNTYLICVVRCSLYDVYVLKILCFGTLTLCAATFCNITSCDVYFMLLYIM
jgi:hypothetical protein